MRRFNSLQKCTRQNLWCTTLQSSLIKYQSSIKNQISRNLGNQMSSQDSKILRIQLYHPLMGIHNFDINNRDNLSDLRTMLKESTPMAIFDNYRFSVNGKLLPEFQQIGQVIQNETRISLLLEPFDQKSSYYHLQQVKDILASPIQWVMLNSRQGYEQKQNPNQKLPQSITICNFLDMQLSSPLYQSHSNQDKHINFLQQFNFSIHNPPPMYRKLAGDFYYLIVRTLQGRQEHITACPQGFYISNSTNTCLNTINSSGLYFYNLLDLFKYLSPKFKYEFNNLKKRYHVNELDKTISNSFKLPPLCQWLKINTENTSKKNKYNQWKHYTINTAHDSSIIKEWNQIIQIHSIIQTDLQIDISNKEKNHYKMHQDFILFAKECAIKAVENQINPLDSTVPFLKRVFIYGSVCIWFAQDNPLSYKKFENSKPTRRTMNIQLRNLQVLQKRRTIDASFRHLALINYKGYDVVVQMIIPGLPLQTHILQKFIGVRNQDKIVEELAKIMKVEGKNLYKTNDGQIQRADVHPQIKCVRGDDKRSYVLNLHAFSTRDLNFQSSRNNASVIRHELLSTFNEKQNCYKNMNTMIESGYNLQSNERVREQEKKSKTLKTYSQQTIVPLCIKSFLRENKKYLADSKTVVKVMHQFGLGSRYLGSIYKKAASFEAENIQIIIERAILVKSLKNMIRQAMRRSELGDIKQTIAKLLNCIFSNETTLNLMDQASFKDQIKDQISTNASRKKKKKQDLDLEKNPEQNFIKAIGNNIRPTQVWQQIKQIAAYRYGLTFKQKKICMLKCLENDFGKYATLRDLCINVGICLQKTQYFQKNGIIFKPDHIEQIKPIIKTINLPIRYLDDLIEQGDILIERKRIQEAIEVYNQAINYASTNFGIMTQQLALLNKKVAQIYFRLGQMDASLLFINCAQKMCQKIYGQSHVETLECYSLLSQFNFFVRNFETAQFYLIKNIHLSTISYGQEYPQLIISYLNLSTIYETTSRFMDSITSTSHALRIVLRVFGEEHLNTAICYAAMATSHFEIPDIQKSIFFQQKSIKILQKLFKPNDCRLKEAQKVLQYYHHLQSTKKVKQNHEKEKKKMIANPQLFAGFPLFRFPDFGMRDRELMYKKMHNMIQYPGKFFG